MADTVSAYIHSTHVYSKSILDPSLTDSISLLNPDPAVFLFLYFLHSKSHHFFFFWLQLYREIDPPILSEPF